jgi:creatinine amidohydrolase
MAIGESVARAGVRKLVMVTSHGGNSAAMSLVAQDLRAHHGCSRSPRAGRASAYRTDLFPRRDAPRHSWRRGRDLDHAGALSAALCGKRRSPIFYPPSIAMEKEFRWLLRASVRPVRGGRAQDLHESGAVGDATKASARKAKYCSITARRAFGELLDRRR